MCDVSFYRGQKLTLTSFMWLSSFQTYPSCNCDCISLYSNRKCCFLFGMLSIPMMHVRRVCTDTLSIYFIAHVSRQSLLLWFDSERSWNREKPLKTVNEREKKSIWYVFVYCLWSTNCLFHTMQNCKDATTRASYPFLIEIFRKVYFINYFASLFHIEHRWIFQSAFYCVCVVDHFVEPYVLVLIQGFFYYSRQLLFHYVVFQLDQITRNFNNFFFSLLL